MGVRDALESKCSHDHEMHIPVEGALTAQTAVYPRQLCTRFAKAILKPVQARCLHVSFEKSSNVLANDSQDYWSQDRGYLIRHHVMPRSQVFKPHEVDTPVELEKISANKVSGLCTYTI